MAALIELPNAVHQQLQALAEREGATPAELIQRFVEERFRQDQPAAPKGREVHLPLIPARETGTIRPITGAELDELLTLEDLAS